MLKGNAARAWRASFHGTIDLSRQGGIGRVDIAGGMIFRRLQQRRIFKRCSLDVVHVARNPGRSPIWRNADGITNIDRPIWRCVVGRGGSATKSAMRGINAVRGGVQTTALELEHVGIAKIPGRRLIEKIKLSSRSF